MRVDAIVNTTNKDMIGYSGVDLAIHTAAGAQLDAECMSLAPLALGEAKITNAYSLPCKKVIHTAGPRWRGGACGERAILRSCYTESLKLAVKNGCTSVAVPLISSGVYGYPKDQALRFAVETVSEFLLANDITVFICVFDKESYAFSKELYNDIKDYIDGDPSFSDTDLFCDSDLASLTSNTFATSRRTSKRVDSIRICSARDAELDDYIKKMGKSFREMLFELIDSSGMTDVECYKKANVDKRVFSKIKSNKDYRPSKQTAVAFAITLKLDLDETQELLATVGLTLSRSCVFDKIIRYFIDKRIYDLFEINEALFEFEQPLLGALN